MDTTRIPVWLWPILVFGGMGALIDLLIGRAGQERARDFLETWWIRFDDVRWNNFGKEEATFAISLLDRYCGRRLLGVRRWRFVIIYFMIAIILGHTIAAVLSHRVFLPLVPASRGVIILAVLSGIGLACTVSITRFLAVLAERLCGTSGWRNLSVFLIFFSLTYILGVLGLVIFFELREDVGMLIELSITVPLSEIQHHFSWGFNVMFFLFVYVPGLFVECLNLLSCVNGTDIVDFIYNRDWFAVTHDGGNRFAESYGFTFALQLAPYIMLILRMASGIVFVGSFVVSGLFIGPISLHWRRIVESDRPVFTLLFSGVSGAAAILHEMIKHF